MGWSRSLVNNCSTLAVGVRTLNIRRTQHCLADPVGKSLLGAQALLARRAHWTLSITALLVFGFGSTRMAREYRLLSDLYEAGLPVPRPVAALARDIS